MRTLIALLLAALLVTLLGAWRYVPWLVGAGVAWLVLVLLIVAGVGLVARVTTRGAAR